MGYGNYSHAAHTALTATRAHQSGTEVFSQTQCHALMNPKGLKVRECRDSPDHPNSLGIAFALDVTGSMGAIPQLLAKQELPNLMKLLHSGIAEGKPCCATPPPSLVLAQGPCAAAPTSAHSAGVGSCMLARTERAASLMWNRTSDASNRCPRVSR